MGSGHSLARFPRRFHPPADRIELAVCDLSVFGRFLLERSVGWGETTRLAAESGIVSGLALWLHHFRIIKRGRFYFRKAYFMKQ